MSIRLTSPPRPAFLDSSLRTSSLRNLFSLDTPAGKLLVSTLVALLLTSLYLYHVLWNEPRSWFYNQSGAYEYRYSAHRLGEAREFISTANATQDVVNNAKGFHNEPVMCIAMMTIKRQHTQYVSDTMGTILAGLTVEERSAIDLRLIFGNVDPEVHPNWNETWLSSLDWVGCNHMLLFVAIN
jgi:hypothetical protein